MNVIQRYTTFLFFLLFFTQFADGQAVGGFKTTPYQSIESYKGSKAVAENFAVSMQRFAAKKSQGKLTTIDVELAAAAMKTTFDNLEEIGYNSELEKNLLEGESVFLNYHPSDDDLNSLQNDMSTRGMKTSLERLRAVLDLPYDQKIQFLASIKKEGLYNTELDLVQNFRTQELSNVDSPAVNTATWRGKKGNVTLKRVGKPLSYQAAVCLMAAGVGLASGCTLTFSACITAVIACGACALSACGY